MKLVFLLAVLTVLLVVPEVEGWRARGWFRGRIVDPLKDKLRKFNDRVQNGRRGVEAEEDVDLNQDGVLDQEELEAMLGERDARDLLDMMDAEDDVTLEDLDRAARELDELEADD